MLWYNIFTLLWRGKDLANLFKKFVNQVNDIIEDDFGVMDDEGTVLACSDRNKEGRTYAHVVEKVAAAPEEIVILGGVSYAKVFIRNKLTYIAFLDSSDKHSRKLLELIVMNIRNMKMHYDEKYDRTNLIKNIIMNNILPGDIALRAKELRLEYNAPRVVFLVKTGKNNDVYPPEIIQNLFPDKNKDFTVVMDDENTVLIRQFPEGNIKQEIDRTAKSIIDTLNTELMVKATVSIGTLAEDIKEIGRSYKEAQTAMLVGGIFESEKSIVDYNNLGLGRLIYQLPTTLCRLFLKEVFKKGALESLDSETILTIQKFFENNLNVSVTARQLYVHRNTLVYRLDKIKKITGLDIREFDDAIIFKIAMLVKKYLDKCDQIYDNV
jgi:carbohydrate diacid regulator